MKNEYINAAREEKPYMSYNNTFTTLTSRARVERVFALKVPFSICQFPFIWFIFLYISPLTVGRFIFSLSEQNPHPLPYYGLYTDYYLMLTLAYGPLLR